MGVRNLIPKTPNFLTPYYDSTQGGLEASNVYL